MHTIKDSKGRAIEAGSRVKYSFNSMGIPIFTGRVIEKCSQYHIEHSNKVTVPLDDKIEYIEVVPEI